MTLDCQRHRPSTLAAAVEAHTFRIDSGRVSEIVDHRRGIVRYFDFVLNDD